MGIFRLEVSLPPAVDHRLDRIEGGIAEILRQITVLQQGAKQMAATVQDIAEAVKQEKDITQSAISLLNQLTALVAANKNDPEALQSILDDVNAQKQALADAIVANTPAAPMIP